MEFLIKDRKVGVDHPPLVIAEIGINHNGSIKEAIKIAKSAIDAGAKLLSTKPTSLKTKCLWRLTSYSWQLRQIYLSNNEGLCSE